MPDIVRDSIVSGIDKLKRYMKFDEDYKMRLILATLINSKFDEQTKPILFLRGGWDSGKTTRGTFLVAIMNDEKREITKDSRGIVLSVKMVHRDYSIKDLINVPFMNPSTPDDYFTIAQNNKCALFDNIDQTDARLYTTICILATGGQLGKRALYTNDELWSQGKPITVIYTGLNIIMKREDVISRHIIIDVPPFKGDKEDEDVLRENFINDLVPIRNAVESLYIQVKSALTNYRNIKIPDKYRLRMYARIGSIINMYLDQPDFLTDYDKVIDISRDIMNSDEIISYIVNFINKEIRNTFNTYCTFSTTKLYEKICIDSPEFEFFCKSNAALGIYLAKHQHLLNSNGINASYKRTAEGASWMFRHMPKYVDHNISFTEEEEEKPVTIEKYV